MTLKFSKPLALAAAIEVVVILSTLALWVADWGYQFGFYNIIPRAAFFFVILWGIVIILSCYRLDQQTITRRLIARSQESVFLRLMAHHKEAITSDEGRLTDQP